MYSCVATLATLIIHGAQLDIKLIFLCAGSRLKTDLDPQDLQDRLGTILAAESLGHVVSHYFCRDTFLKWKYGGKVWFESQWPTAVYLHYRQWTFCDSETDHCYSTPSWWLLSSFCLFFLIFVCRGKIHPYSSHLVCKMLSTEFSALLQVHMNIIPFHLVILEITRLHMTI